MAMPIEVVLKWWCRHWNCRVWVNEEKINIDLNWGNCIENYVTFANRKLEIIFFYFLHSLLAEFHIKFFSFYSIKKSFFYPHVCRFFGHIQFFFMIDFKREKKIIFQRKKKKSFLNIVNLKKILSYRVKLVYVSQIKFIRKAR